MNACMHGLTVVCVCVRVVYVYVYVHVCVFVYVYVVGWFGRLVCRVEQSTFANSGKGTFTNCNFTSNSASVSLEEEHVDGCEMSECMTLRLCPPCISS